MARVGPVQRIVTASYLAVSAGIGVLGVLTTLAGLALLFTGAPN